MNKTITLITTLMLVAVTATAQRLNYSAVVRNNDNELVTNENVTVRIAISPASNGNPVVYSETHQTTTNQNGLVRLTVGNGTLKNGNLSDVSWPAAYIISEFTLPDGTHVSSIMPVNAVPYALYVDNVSVEGFIDVVESMTPEQITTLRETMGILEPQPQPATFSCGTDKMIDADGNLYETVLIGEQCWTKTNLRTTRYRDGHDIQIPGSQATYYRPAANEVGNYTDSIFGLYYTWYAAADTGNSKLCPTGWHVPSNADWHLLTDYLMGNNNFWCDNSNNDIAFALASKQYWTDCIGGTNISSCGVCQKTNNNMTGFSAIPAGYYYDGAFNNVTLDAIFWSSTFSGVSLTNEDKAYVLYMFALNPNVNHKDDFAEYGLSVRCLRDGTDNSVEPPTVTTANATGVTTVKATLLGSYSNPGNLTVISTGFEWKTVGASSYNVADASGEAMSYELTTLIPDTQYTYRAFVATADSVYYGEEMMFTTDKVVFPTIHNPCPGQPTVTDHEGNLYNTVKIGNQCWTRENMRCTTSPKGYLSNGKSVGYSDENYYKAYYFENVEDNIPTSVNDTSLSGMLYNWAGAMDTSATEMFNISFFNRRGICPEGWHVPSSAEWSEMEATLADDSPAGRLSGSDFWRPKNEVDPESVPGDYGWSSRNSSGFFAVPAGYYTSNTYISNLDATFWTSISTSNTGAIQHSWRYNSKTIIISETANKRVGRSVRCVKD